jgi:hypothetical protein
MRNMQTSVGHLKYRTANGRIATVESMSLEEYVSADRDIPVHEELSPEWESELLNSVCNKSKECTIADSENLNDEEVDDESDEIESELVLKTHREAIQSIENIRMYCLSEGLTDVVELFNSAQDRLEKDSVKALGC